MEDIYLDNAATTRCDPQAAAVALELMTECYGNPSSLHRKGIEAQQRLDDARARLAAAVGCEAEEILFTGSGTEANNLAIYGAANALRRRGNKIVAQSTLHSSALEPLRDLERQGFIVFYVPPKPDGSVDVEALAEAVDSNTVLLVCELVNGEVGTVAPIGELCRLARRRSENLFIHCDCVQGLGKVRFAAKRLGVDFLSVSGHKVHAPKGCGALYLQKKARLMPLIRGGGQEKGMRAGTENTPAACAFGFAAWRAVEEFEQRHNHVEKLREYIVNKTATIGGVCINSPGDATPYISNLSVPGFRSETMLHFLAGQGIYVSSGSACSRGAASHVLRAMGLDRRRADSALRVSLSHYNTTWELEEFFAALTRGMETLARSNR